jgi:hypothetical protein
MIQSRTCLQPLELISREGVSSVDLKCLAIPLCDADLYRCVLARKQVCKTKRLHNISGANARVICLVGEPEGKDALLLQVGLVNARERSSDDYSTPWVS